MVKSELHKKSNCVLQIHAYRKNTLLRKGSGIIIKNSEDKKYYVWSAYHLYNNNNLTADKFVISNKNCSFILTSCDITCIDPLKDILIFAFDNRINEFFKYNSKLNLSKGKNIFVMDAHGVIYNGIFLKYDFILHKNITYLCIKADVRKGNSGNPVFNAERKVIGIISAGSKKNRNNLAYAIPAKDFLDCSTQMYNTEIGQKCLRYFDKGYLNFERRNYKKSLFYYEKYLKYYYNNDKAYYFIGNVYHFFGIISRNKSYYGAAQKYYLHSLKINPSSEQANYYLGNIFYDLNNNKEAIHYYSKVLKQNPYNVKALLNRGNVYLKEKKIRKALSDYNKAASVNPEYKDVYNNRGSLYFDLKLYKKSLKDFETALDMDKRDSVAYNNRGNYYHYFGKYEKALSDYNKSIMYKKDSFEPYIRRGILMQKTGKINAAISDFDKAISNFKNKALPYLYRGECHLIKKNYLQAIKDWKKAASLNYQNKSALLRKIKLAERHYTISKS